MNDLPAGDHPDDQADVGVSRALLIAKVAGIYATSVSEVARFVQETIGRLALLDDKHHRDYADGETVTAEVAELVERLYDLTHSTAGTRTTAGADGLWVQVVADPRSAGGWVVICIVATSETTRIVRRLRVGSLRSAEALAVELSYVAPADITTYSPATPSLGDPAP